MSKGTHIAPSIPDELISDTVFREFGKERKDPFYRLREKNNSRVIEHLKKENQYALSVSSSYKHLQDLILKELTNRVPPEDEGYPYQYKGWYYGYYYEKGKNYPVHFRSRQGDRRNPEILLDENEIITNNPFLSVGQIELSPDEKFLAYSVDLRGDLCYSIFIKNRQNGKVWEAVPAITSGSIVWDQKSKSIFYVKKQDVTLRPYQVYRHFLNESHTNNENRDRLIFEEKDETFICDVVQSSDERFLLVESQSTETTEIRYTSLDNPATLQVILLRERGHLYYADSFEDSWIIRTNYRAPNFSIVSLPKGKCHVKDFKTIIPEQEYLIEDIVVNSSWMAWEGIFDGSLDVYYITWNDLKIQKVTFSNNSHITELAYNNDFNLPYLRIQHTDLKTPATLYDVYPGEKPEFRFRRKLNFTHNSEDYEDKLIHVPSRDGKQIPVSLIYNKNIYKKGQNPLLIEAYGAYGISFTPAFRFTLFSLLDRGFLYAIAHVRGGQDMGRFWYEEGRLLNKKNTFFDFIDCAEYLKNNDWCSPEKIFASGGSAGGLLMGAVLNMRPDLWAGIIAHVPFVDVVTTMLDESIPLTTGEYDEWGNPHQKEFYEYMLSYSPYDNIPDAKFPPILVTSGYNDAQVQYWEPAKWVLRLRERNTGKNPIIFFCEMETGHAGKSGRYDVLEEYAREFAFLLHHAGLD